MKKLFIIFYLILLSFSHRAVADTVNLKSLYPLPFSTYKNLVLTPQANFTCRRPGTLYVDGAAQINLCTNSGAIPLSYGGIWKYDDATGHNYVYAVKDAEAASGGGGFNSYKQARVAIGTSTASSIPLKLTLEDNTPLGGSGSGTGNFVAEDLPSDKFSTPWTRLPGQRFDYTNAFPNTLPTLNINTSPSAATARLLWYANKAAFRAGAVELIAGSVTEDYWKDTNMGRWSVAFGFNNLAKADLSTIASGQLNKIYRRRGTILGGQNNTIPAMYTNPPPPANSVDNFEEPMVFSGVLGESSTIIAGSGNYALSYFNTIGAGESNITGEANGTPPTPPFSISAKGHGASIVAGKNNQEIGSFSLIGAGESNKIYDADAVFGAGFSNIVKGNFSAILGGESNTIDAPDPSDTNNNFNFIGSGKTNYIRGRSNFIGGGLTNCIDWGISRSASPGSISGANDYNTILGGNLNYVTGQYSFIGGGANNFAGGLETSGNIGPLTGVPPNFDQCSDKAGTSPTESIQYTTVLGGQLNQAQKNYTFIGGGYSNIVRGTYSSILGGNTNTITSSDATHLGNYSFIAGGERNKVTGNYSAILGGRDNTIDSNYSLIPMGKNIKIAAGADGTFAFGFLPGVGVGNTAPNPSPITITQPDAFILYSESSAGVKDDNLQFLINVLPTAAATYPSIALNGSNYATQGYRLVTNGGDFDITGNLYLITPPTTFPITTPFLKITPGPGNALSKDLAELFDTSEDVESGDLLTVDEHQKQKLKKSSMAYDPKAVGVVSAAPAITFEGSQLKISPKPFEFTKGKKPPVALEGRVMCKVSLENGPIQKGDVLTSSSTPGHAMKATDRDKSFGAVVGRALEDFKNTDGRKTGMILMLISRQ